jgi:hypothetical protein
LIALTFFSAIICKEIGTRHETSENVINFEISFATPTSVLVGVLSFHLNALASLHLDFNYISRMFGGGTMR